MHIYASELGPMYGYADVMQVLDCNVNEIEGG